MPDTVDAAFDWAHERLDAAFRAFWTGAMTAATIDELSTAASDALVTAAAVIVFTNDRQHHGETVDLIAAKRARLVLEKAGLGLGLVAWKRGETATEHARLGLHDHEKRGR